MLSVTEYPKAPGSILPDILAVAEAHGLMTKRISSRADEVRANCPFCGDTKYHLYLNTEKLIFNCFRCGTRGGVVRFLSLLTGESETSILEELKGSLKQKNNKRKTHPAISLNVYQLKNLGYEKLDWHLAFQVDPERARDMANRIWQEWQEFLNYEKEKALEFLYIAIAEGNYRRGIERIKARSKELGHDLLTPCLKAYSASNPPKWVVEAKNQAKLWLSSKAKKVEGGR